MSHPFEPTDPGKPAAPEPEFPPELIQCIPRHIGQPDGTDILRALRDGGWLRGEPREASDEDIEALLGMIYGGTDIVPFSPEAHGRMRAVLAEAQRRGLVGAAPEDCPLCAELSEELTLRIAERDEARALIDCDPGDGIPRGCGGQCNVCLRLLVETVEGERDAAAAALAALRERIEP